MDPCLWQHASHMPVAATVIGDYVTIKQGGKLRSVTQ